ncbi:ubiquitin-like protein ATG12 [Gouania willdenowi]|uniref:Ubiquitin-like protein ATG12 n=1 Tax=Gouania willdenowi TaxID=441366 RepID=A0A8C5DHE4_GOUWI|nr:ubiquitin-like protein ATG12 [Gouania willdenowi]
MWAGPVYSRQSEALKMSETAESPTETPQEGRQPPTDDSTAAEEKKKIDVLLKAVGDTPIMKKKKWTVERMRTVHSLSQFISRFLKLDTNEELFIYINQSFAPSPDQEVGILFDCYGSDNKLVLHYCKNQAWG